MSNNVSGNDFASFKSLIEKLAKQNEQEDVHLQNSDLFNIFDKAQQYDKNSGNNDGKIDLKEFLHAASDAFDFKADVDKFDLGDFEDDYADFTGGDNDFSFADAKAAVQSQKDNASNPNKPESLNKENPSNNYKSDSYTDSTGFVKESKTNKAKQADIAPVSIPEGASSQDLESARQTALSDLNAARNEKSKLNDNENVKNAEKGVKDAHSELDKAEKAAMEKIAENNEEVQALKEQKAANETAITEQQSFVDGIKSDISSTQTAIDDTNASLNALTEPSEADFKETVEEEVDGKKVTKTKTNSVAYHAALKAYEDEKAQLEEQLQQQEEQLNELNAQLTEAQDSLTALEEERNDIDSRIQYTLFNSSDVDDDVKQNLTDKANGIQDSEYALYNAKDEIREQEAQIDANIAQLEMNVEEYDNAIAETKATEAKAQESDDVDGAEEVQSTGKTENADDTTETDSKDKVDGAEKSEKTENKEGTDDKKETVGSAYKDGARVETKKDKDGNEYDAVTVDKWDASKPDNNDCLSRIIKNTYDLDALGIKMYGDDYNKLEKAIMDANPDIYGDENGKGGRPTLNISGDSSRHNAILYTGDEVKLPTDDELRKAGINVPEKEEAKADDDKKADGTDDDKKTDGTDGDKKTDETDDDKKTDGTDSDKKTDETDGDKKTDETDGDKKTDAEKDADKATGNTELKLKDKDGNEVSVDVHDGWTDQEELSDGRVKFTYPDGSTVTVNPNASVLNEDTKESGSKELVYADKDGNEVTLDVKDGWNKQEILDDGTIKFTYPDGSEKTVNPAASNLASIEAIKGTGTADGTKGASEEQNEWAKYADDPEALQNDIIGPVLDSDKSVQEKIAELKDVAENLGQFPEGYDLAQNVFAEIFKELNMDSEASIDDVIDAQKALSELKGDFDGTNESYLSQIGRIMSDKISGKEDLEKFAQNFNLVDTVGNLYDSEAADNVKNRVLTEVSNAFDKAGIKAANDPDQDNTDDFETAFAKGKDEIQNLMKTMLENIPDALTEVSETDKADNPDDAVKTPETDKNDALGKEPNYSDYGLTESREATLKDNYGKDLGKILEAYQNGNLKPNEAKYLLKRIGSHDTVMNQFRNNDIISWDNQEKYIGSLIQIYAEG